MPSIFLTPRAQDKEADGVIISQCSGYLGQRGKHGYINVLCVGARDAKTKLDGQTREILSEPGQGPATHWVFPECAQRDHAVLVITVVCRAAVKFRNDENRMSLGNWNAVLPTAVSSRSNSCCKQLFRQWEWPSPVFIGRLLW